MKKKRRTTNTELLAKAQLNFQGTKSARIFDEGEENL